MSLTSENVNHLLSHTTIRVASFDAPIGTSMSEIILAWYGAHADGRSTDALKPSSPQIIMRSLPGRSDDQLLSTTETKAREAMLPVESEITGSLC
jgi:hypothetical protein